MADDPREHALTLALAAAAAFGDHLADALLDRLAAVHANGADPGLLLHAAQSVLEGHVAPLAALLADGHLGAWLLGAEEVVKALPRELPPLLGAGQGPPAVLPPAAYGWEWSGSPVWLPVVEAAVSDLRARRLVTRPEWDQLQDDARRGAFTTAYLRSADALGTVRDAVTSAVAQGDTFPLFRDRVEQTLGAGQLGQGHLETVFRTNVFGAATAGEERVLANPVVGEVFPYEEQVLTDDSRITELCWTIGRSGIAGTAIYRRDDPVIKEFRKPRHYNCRCNRRFLTVAEAAARGIAEAAEWLRTGVPPQVPAWVPRPPVALPDGWTSGG